MNTKKKKNKWKWKQKQQPSVSLNAVPLWTFFSDDFPSVNVSCSENVSGKVTNVWKSSLFKIFFMTINKVYTLQSMEFVWQCRLVIVAFFSFQFLETKHLKQYLMFMWSNNLWAILVAVKATILKRKKWMFVTFFSRFIEMTKRKNQTLSLSLIQLNKHFQFLKNFCEKLLQTIWNYDTTCAEWQRAKMMFFHFGRSFRWIFKHEREKNIMKVAVVDRLNQTSTKNSKSSNIQKMT